jgi:GNAT superfamily N-acetyltransferase
MPNQACTRTPAKYAGAMVVGLPLRGVRVFRQFSLLKAGSVKAALYCPTHQLVPLKGGVRNTPSGDGPVRRFPSLANHQERDNLITIRRIQIGEFDLFKQMRLTSLQDAPYAFPSTYDAALRRSAESWHEQAERTAQGADRTTFIAFSNDVPVGIAALYRLEERFDVGELLQVWVSPEYRGTKVAWDLMDAIFRWAGANNFRRIIAGVTNVNARALKFYTKYGFSIIDKSSPNDSNGVQLVKEVK